MHTPLQARSQLFPDLDAAIRWAAIIKSQPNDELLSKLSWARLFTSEERNKRFYSPKMVSDLRDRPVCENEHRVNMPSISFKQSPTDLAEQSMYQTPANHPIRAELSTLDSREPDLHRTCQSNDWPYDDHFDLVQSSHQSEQAPSIKHVPTDGIFTREYRRSNDRLFDASSSRSQRQAVGGITQSLVHPSNTTGNSRSNSKRGLNDLDNDLEGKKVSPEFKLRKLDEKDADYNHGEAYSTSPKSKLDQGSTAATGSESQHCSCRVNRPEALQESNYLRQEIRRLQEQVEKLQNEKSYNLPKDYPDSTQMSRWPVMYRVHCPVIASTATYLDRPIWILDGDEHYHLNSRSRIPDEIAYESRTCDTSKCSFVQYLEYDCDPTPTELSLGNPDDNKQRAMAMSHETKTTKRSLQDPVSPTGQEVHILSIKLRHTIAQVFTEIQGLDAYYPSNFARDCRFRAPYLMHYHFAKEMADAATRIASSCKVEYSFFLEFLRSESEDMERKADKLLATHVNHEFIPYLFQPGRLLLKHNGPDYVVVRQIGKIARDGARWRCDCLSLQFDGHFSYVNSVEWISFPDTDEENVLIQDLNIYPLIKTDERLRAQLLKRGQFFYDCRTGLCVVGPADEYDGLSEARYMVDVKTYYLIHSQRRSEHDFEHDVENEGSKEFLLMLPARVEGFHMKEKKWVTLPVDRLKEVQWDEQAFETLAIPDGTKELVQALVTKKIEADQGTDLVAGKGTGLILLLHGGPGTGKTLTAEGVSEIAKKPLYRVSCGDVGTNPKEVEAYLEKVFLLGRIWKCVVLLDEAEVFLERRSFANLERNALVSVFLRVLEYYDGILLLTSNRVGMYHVARLEALSSA